MPLTSRRTLGVRWRWITGLPARGVLAALRSSNRLRALSPILAKASGRVENLSLLPRDQQLHIFELPGGLDHARRERIESRRKTRLQKRVRRSHAQTSRKAENGATDRSEETKPHSGSDEAD